MLPRKLVEKLIVSTNIFKGLSMALEKTMEKWKALELDKLMRLVKEVFLGSDLGEGGAEGDLVIHCPLFFNAASFSKLM